MVNEKQPNMAKVETVLEPSNWREQLDNIKKMRLAQIAPVDTDGCSLLARKHNYSEKQARFISLVALMLSSQTKDEVTSAAVSRLHGAECLSPERICDIDKIKLENLLKPVSFYRTKTTNLKKTCKIILEKFEGDIPDNLNDLKTLPGVGPKMAYLAMQCAWNVCVGIGVDVHVHRITNRLNWVKTKTPEKTRISLEAWLPKEHWVEINQLLVGFGQTICRKLKPKCDQCLNKQICPFPPEDIF